MKVVQIVISTDQNILGLGDDNRMYIWDEYTAHWELLRVKTEEDNLGLDLELGKENLSPS